MKFPCGKESHGEHCYYCDYEECINWEHYHTSPETEIEYLERTEGNT